MSAGTPRLRRWPGAALALAGACLPAAMAPLPVRADAAPAPAPAAHDLRWLATSGTWAASSPERGCVTSTLQTSYALVAFIDAGLGDDAVQKALLTNVSTPGLRQLRQEEMSQWRRHHDPGEISAWHLPGCLHLTGITLAGVPAQHDILRACLRQTEPAALAMIHRQGGKDQPEALKAVTARYAAPVLQGDPGALVAKVYGAPVDADLTLRESMFDRCLSAALTHKAPPRPHP